MTSDTQITHRVFIDESGGITGTGERNNFYVCTAVIVHGDNEAAVLNGIDNVRQNLANGAPLKSSSVGNRDQLRLKYLQELCKLPFSFVALITDKRRINPDSGLKYKKTRYKFIHNKLNAVLKKALTRIELVVDEHGSKEFQDECVKYFENNYESDLFGGVTVRYSDDLKEPLLQLADFIGGSLLYCFDPDRSTPVTPSFRELLRSCEAGISFFPIGRKIISQHNFGNEGINDELLQSVLNNAAYDFLSRHEKEHDGIVKMQMYTLQRLFGASEYGEGAQRCIFSDVILRELKELGFQVTKRNFTTDIIGGLRKEGIIISGSPYGYKLALSIGDITEYLDHDNSIIIPMLEKLRLAKETVKTGVSYDILAKPQFKILSDLVGVIDDCRLDEYGAGPEPDIEKITLITEDKV